MPEQVTEVPGSQAAAAPAKPADLAPGGKPWKEALDEVVSSRDALKEKARAYESELAKYKAEAQVRAQAEAVKSDEIQRKQLEEQGKYQEALRTTESKWKNQLDTVRSTAAARLVPLAIQTAAGQIQNLTPEAARDLPALLRDRIAIDENTLELYVKGTDGKPLMDDKLNPVPVEAYVQSFVAERPYLMTDAMPARHGQAGGKAKPNFDFAKTIDNPELGKAWEQADPAGYDAARKAYWSPENQVKVIKAKLNK
jgi:hypothetical protein